MALFRMVALTGLNLPRHQVRSTVGTAISAFGGKRHISVRHMSLSCDRLFGKSLATGTFSQRRFLSSQEDDAVREDLLQYKGGSVDLRMDEDTGIADIILNHPEKKNALSGTMMVDLRDAVMELETWTGGKGVLVYGANGTFCSGGDLQLMESIANPVDGGRMSRFMHETTLRLARLPLVSVAALYGRSLGGGAELAVACDFRLMVLNGKLGFVQRRMGVSPGWGGGVRIVQLLGPTVALELLTSGRVLSCSEALGVGLLSGVLDDEHQGTETPSQAKTWLKEHTAASPAVIQAAKNVVNNATDYEHLLLKENDVFMSVWGGPAHHDAMTNSVKHD